MNKIEVYKKIIDDNKDLNFILSNIDWKNNTEGSLSKYVYIIKDNISMKDTITTGGSLFLKDYKSPYSATVVELLNNAGATPIAKSNLDEFGLGGTGLYSAYEYVKNPYDKNRITGGSSSGSAVAQALKCCDFALGTDTGDSIRKPASYLGVIGYKPSYGIISRYGVLPYAPSLDHVGLFAKNFKVIFDVMKVIGKYDSKDFSSQNFNIDFNFVNLKLNKLKICVINEMYDELDKQVVDLFNNTISKLNLKINKVSFNIDLLNLIPSTYQILSYAEAVSCYQSFTGITFGAKEEGNNFEEIARNSRTKNFGSELKRRFTIGSYCTINENYKELFLKSKKIRTLIKNQMDIILRKNHFVISLGSNNIAPLIEDVINGKENLSTNVDNILQISNFGGYPSITIPMGKINGMPIGINITSRFNSDQYLLSFAKIFYDIIRMENKND